MSPTGCPSDRATGTVDFGAPDVDRPKQGELVVAVQRGYRVALLGQRLDPAPFRQELPDLAAKCGIGFLGLGRLKHFSEDADQGFFDPAMLVVQRFQPLLGCCLCSPDTAQHHLESVRRVHACVPGAA